MYPSFRSDLVATPIVENGEQYVDVADPVTGKAFRFFDVEYALAVAMNGQRSLNDVASWALEDLGLDVEVAELETLIETLNELGYLTEPAQLPDVDDEPTFEFDGQPTRVSSREVTAEALLQHEKAVAAARSGVEAHTEVTRPVDIERYSQQAGADAPLGLDLETFPPNDGPPAPGVLIPAADEPAIETEIPLQLETDPPAGQVEPLETDDPTGQFKPTGNTIDIPASDAAQAIEAQLDPLSVDLSEHVDIGGDDVREAVRHSQAMAAQAPPDPMANTMLGMQSPLETGTPAAPEPPQTPGQPAITDAPSIPLMSSEPASEPPPSPSAEMPVTTSGPNDLTERVDRVVSHHKKPEKKSSLMPWLVAILCLAILGVGGYYVYVNKDRLFGGDEETQTSSSASRPPAQKAPTAKLAGTEGRTEDIKVSGVSGRINVLVANGTLVKKGDVIGRIGNTSSYEKSVERYTDKIEKDYGARMVTFKANLKEAKNEGDESKQKRWKRKIEELENKIAGKQKLLDKAKEKLAEREVVAPIDGTLKLLVKNDDRIADVDNVHVASIVTEGQITATFKGAATKAYAAGDRVVVTSGGKSYPCKASEVVTAPEPSLKVECDPKLTPGALVTLTPKK